MTIYKHLYMLLLVSILSGCMTSLEIRATGSSLLDQNKWELVLLQPINLPANHASVKIQFGNLSQGRQLDHYHANCNFEVTNIVDSGTVIQPDVFSIYKIAHDKDYVQSHHFYYASLAEFAGEGSTLAIEASTEFYLQSDKQPNVFRLTCSHWDDPDFPRHLTIDQINSTLKGWLEIRKAER